jgi:uncharacterized phage-associated protein
VNTSIVAFITNHPQVEPGLADFPLPKEDIQIYYTLIEAESGDRMKLLFNEAKATQAAARLLRLRGGRMSYVKLIKLLYLADREALIRWGRPLTTDSYLSTDAGPVVSRISDLIRNEPSPNSAKIWRKFISGPEDYEVHLLGDPGTSELSPAEEELIGEVFCQHGQDSRWALVDYTYGLPEWTCPDGGARPIEYRDILKAAHKTEPEISAIEDQLESLALGERVLA